MKRLAIKIGILAVIIYVWHLIYRYFGHSISQSSIDFCKPLEYPYPDYYEVNRFGHNWIYSTIAFIVLFLFILVIKKNWNTLKLLIAQNNLKISLILSGLIAASILLIIFGPGIKQKYDLYKKYQNAMYKFNYKNYIGAIKGLKAIQGYKDTDKKIKEAQTKLEKDAATNFKNGNYEEAVTELTFLHSNSPKDKQLLSTSNYLIEEQKKENLLELKATAPYDGMLETDIPLSSWGKPTDVQLCQDYYSLREDHQFKYYEWITKNKDGQITEIKTLQVNRGAVYGKPEISHYNVH